MNRKRIAALCRHLGLEPSHEQVAEALNMSRQQADRYLRSVAKQGVPFDPGDVTCHSGFMLTNQDIRDVCNHSRGASFRVIVHCRDEIITLQLKLAKAIHVARARGDMLSYAETLIPSHIEEAKRRVEDEHHPDQLRLFE